MLKEPCYICDEQFKIGDEAILRKSRTGLVFVHEACARTELSGTPVIDDRCGPIFTDLENKTTALDQQNQEMVNFHRQNRDAIIIGIQVGKIQAAKEARGEPNLTPEETADYFLGGV